MRLQWLSGRAAAALSRPAGAVAGARLGDSGCRADLRPFQVFPRGNSEDMFPDSARAEQQQPRSSSPGGWIGMGSGGALLAARRRLWDGVAVTVLLLAVLGPAAHCQQCRIKRCNTDYVASTSAAGGLQEEASVDYCPALRAYALCTRRQGCSCRGDLVYHSAVFRIKELFSKHNCSSDGPGSPAKAPSTTRPAVHSQGLSTTFLDAHCQQCRIQRCNANYVASTSAAGGLQEDVSVGVDYCIALRAYALCVKRQARSCRGDLVYHSAVFPIKELFSKHNCSSDGPTSFAKAPSTSRPAAAELCNYESRVLTSGAAQQKKYAHCGLFGDPHLRTFRDEFQTCKVEGAWPLIDNRFLSVQVTNVPVVLGSSATATSKITVIFKSYIGCSDQKVYQATTDDLPLAFQDGTRSGGESGSLSVWERGGSGAGRQVRIQARYIGTSIIIRRVGSYLTFAIRMPEDTLDFSEDGGGGLQLCLHGCPQNELIKEHTVSRQRPRLPPGANAQPGPPRPPPQAYTVERATAKCREALQVEDVYFQSCVFDLLTTGDPEFSMAAYGALEDLKALPPSKLKQNPPRTPPDPSRGASGPLAAAPGLLLAPLCVLLL
ncbi:RGM domain family, member D isoform X2 [Oryzias melastigma]|uniref:RGM domain family, member D n=1 Tax=Oryzias melastigma TaxID=30732 RepID=A0A3B3CKI3_ORYME|nr:RGM domain family, member D isoform X2 [Oryzias melastigma]